MIPARVVAAKNLSPVVGGQLDRNLDGTSCRSRSREQRPPGYAMAQATPCFPALGVVPVWVRQEV
jgi:hypothetical protein